MSNNRSICEQEAVENKTGKITSLEDLRGILADSSRVSVYENVDLAALRYMQQFYDDIHELFLKRMREDENFCIAFWSALANVSWYHESDANNTEIGYSFRAAGDLISGILCTGHYMDWYCSGPSGVVSKEIATAMASKGWRYELL